MLGIGTLVHLKAFKKHQETPHLIHVQLQVQGQVLGALSSPCEIFSEMEGPSLYGVQVLPEIRVRHMGFLKSCTK